MLKGYTESRQEPSLPRVFHCVVPGGVEEERETKKNKRKKKTTTTKGLEEDEGGEEGGGGGRVSPLDLSRELGVEYAKYVNGQGERARKDSTTRAKSRDGKCGAAAPVCAKTRRWEGGGVGGGIKGEREAK